MTKTPKSKRILAAALILLASVACRLLNQGPSIVGTWEGVYEGETVVMTFRQDGGFEMHVEENSASGTYRVDYSQTPMHLDIFLEGNDPVLTIIEFIGADRLRVANNLPDDSRPTRFDDALTLKRTGK